MPIANRKNRVLVVTVISLVWLLALILPAAGWGYGEAPMPGYLVLLIGWLGILNLQFGWFANILLVPCTILLLADRRPDQAASLVIGIGMIALVVNSIFWTHAHTPDGDYQVVRGIGYYIWAADLVAAATCLIAVAFWQKDRTREEQ